MSIFARISPPPIARTRAVFAVSLVLSVLFIVMVVAQLFTYEDFPAALSGYWVLGDQVMVQLFAALLVTAEVFALPFLLGVPVSPLMRLFSLACGWAVAAAWAVLGAWSVMTDNNLSGSAVLGATVSVPAGAWQLIYGLLLLALVGYVTWGSYFAPREAQ